MKFALKTPAKFREFVPKSNAKVDLILPQPIRSPAYGRAKVLRGVKAPQTRKKAANGFENLLLQRRESHSENF